MVTGKAGWLGNDGDAPDSKAACRRPNEYPPIMTDRKALLGLGEDHSCVLRPWLSADGHDWQRLGAIDILWPSQDMASGIAVIDSPTIASGDAWDRHQARRADGVDRAFVRSPHSVPDP